MDFLIPIFAIVAVFGSMTYVAYVVLEAFRLRQHARLTSEFHHKLLDRVGSAQELGVLLNTEGGAKLLSSWAARPKNGGAPHARILRAIQAGFVLLALGVGLFAFVFFSPSLPLDGTHAITIFATIGVSLGVGLLLAAGASYGLSRRMGLLDDESDHRSTTPVHSA